MKKILVIEDEQEVRENLVELLELSDYEVVDADNGKVGVQQAMLHLPDLILCDIMMPELDGFGVLRILERKAETTDIPFVFLSAKADKSDFRRGMNLGADDYITKPYDDVELLDAIEMRLKKSERMKNMANQSKQDFKSFINEAKGLEDFKQLSDNQETRTFFKKEFIFQEGDLPKRLYYLQKGKVKLCKVNELGKEYLLDIVEAGEFFGSLALLQGEEYAESAMVMEDASIAYIPKNDFLLLLHNNRDFSAHFIKLLVSNVQEQEGKLLSLAYSSIRKRVADALLELYQIEGEKISILRDDLASMVGTAKESVIRTLRDFKNEGLITTKDGIITVLSITELAKMPN
ncbi:MAG: response regulator [Bacteroidota bacterium]